MKKVWLILGGVFILILLFVVSRIFILTYSFSDRSVENNPHNLCLESTLSLKFIEEFSCKDDNIVKINIKNYNNVDIKGVAFFDGFNLIHKSYDSGENHEFSYDLEFDSLGFSAIFDNNNEEFVCALNRVQEKLRECS